MSGLVSFYKSHMDDLIDQEAIIAILNGKKIDEAAMFSLIAECQDLLIERPQDIVCFYHKLLTIVLLRPHLEKPQATFDLHINALLKKGKKEGYWETIQLPQAIAALTLFLTNGSYKNFKTVQLEKGGVLLDSGNHIFDGNVIKPIENTLLALIWIYLGWANHDEKILSSGLKLASFCINFCDKDGVLFKGLWIKEFEYDPLKLYSHLTLLFSIVLHFQNSSKMHVLNERLYENLEKVTVDKVDTLTFLLATQFCKLIKEKTPFPEVEKGLTLHDIDHSLGFIRYDYENISLACSACGVNTGLGSMHKQHIQIVSFGPQYNPLADSGCFGFYRTSNGNSEGFKDIKIERETERCQFKGWTRLVAPSPVHLSKQNFSYAYPGDQWMFFNMKVYKNILELDIKIDKYIEESPISYAFFISADKAKIEGYKVINPGSLDRFQGVSTSVVFEKQGETLLIEPLFHEEMEVIPLAGKNHFWSADFLIAFSLKKKLKPYSWKVQ